MAGSHRDFDRLAVARRRHGMVELVKKGLLGGARVSWIATADTHAPVRHTGEQSIFPNSKVQAGERRTVEQPRLPGFNLHQRDTEGVDIAINNHDVTRSPFGKLTGRHKC